MNIQTVNIDNLIYLPRKDLSIEDIVPSARDNFKRYGMDFNKNLNLKGKYCYHPFNTVTIDSNGDCFVCVCQAWLPVSVGNILEFNSLTEIVQSPKAREIQASIVDGTYKYCDDNNCHIIKSNEFEYRISHRPDTVNWIVFAIDDSCNLSCPSCRREMIFHKDGPEFEKRMRISEHITKLIQNHHHFLKFTLSGDGDPFASHVYRHILENLQLTEEDPIEIEIVTNGMLIASHWERMKGIHKHVKRFKISFDAATAETYAVTRRQGDWEKLIENSKYIIKWKQKYYSQMDIVSNFVVQNANYREILPYAQLTSELGFDEISFQKVADWGRWWEGNKNYFVEHAIWMENHPGYNELVNIVNHDLLNDRKIQLNNLAYLKKAENNKLESLVSMQIKLQNNIDLEKLGDQMRKLKEYYQQENYGYFAAEEYKNLNEAYTKLSTAYDELAIQQDLLLTQIKNQIHNIAKNYFSRGYIINGSRATDRTDVNGEKLRELVFLEAGTRDLVLAQIGIYSNWQYPTLEIGPGEGTWTEHLVAGDPLYLVDIHQEFLDLAKLKFNSHYQNKLRPYVTDETNLDMLPQNQIGFVFSWNVFNYLTPDLVDRYLESIWKVLRPGGVAMFSYNNAERKMCARNVATGYMSYLPKSLLLSMVAKYEYEILGTEDHEEYISWIEIKKPGTLSTIKAHAPLGVVMSK